MQPTEPPKKPRREVRAEKIIQAVLEWQRTSTNPLTLKKLILEILP